MKIVVSSIISTQQTLYIAQRCINKSGRPISDLFNVTKTMKVKGYLVAIDMEKAFDSLDHTFLISVLEICGFEKIL